MLLSEMTLFQTEKLECNRLENFLFPIEFLPGKKEEKTLMPNLVPYLVHDFITPSLIQVFLEI